MLYFHPIVCSSSYIYFFCFFPAPSFQPTEQIPYTTPTTHSDQTYVPSTDYSAPVYQPQTESSTHSSEQPKTSSRPRRPLTIQNPETLEVINIDSENTSSSSKNDASGGSGKDGVRLILRCSWEIDKSAAATRGDLKYLLLLSAQRERLWGLRIHVNLPELSCLKKITWFLPNILIGSAFVNDDPSKAYHLEVDRIHKGHILLFHLAAVLDSIQWKQNFHPIKIVIHLGI